MLNFFVSELHACLIVLNWPLRPSYKVQDSRHFPSRHSCNAPPGMGMLLDLTMTTTAPTATALPFRIGTSRRATPLPFLLASLLPSFLPSLFPSISDLLLLPPPPPPRDHFSVETNYRAIGDLASSTDTAQCSANISRT